MAGETVLIVEDRRENIVHLANNVLKPNGYQVITAMDGQRGLKRAMIDRPDLIIMDLNMPKMDGLEVLAALQERELDIPVILTTFYGSDQVAQQAMQLGAVAYVIKPFTINEMLSAVEKALADRTLPPLEAEPEIEPEPEEEPELEDEREPDDEPEEMIPLTRQMERWMRDMNILTRVGKALVAQMDDECVCTRAVEAAIYFSRADYGFLFLMEEDTAQLHLCAARGPRDREARLTDQLVDAGLPNQVARSGRTMLQTQIVGDPFLSEMVGYAAGPTIATPLRWQRQTLGVLVVIRDPNEPAFNEADVEWLSGLAEYTAIAMRNARAFQEQTQPKAIPDLDQSLVDAWQCELDQLVSDLERVTGTVERLAALLDELGEAST
jgi:CheY-like chemotaxis protein